jgi:hypothetical protein
MSKTAIDIDQNRNTYQRMCNNLNGYIMKKHVFYLLGAIMVVPLLFAACSEEGMNELSTIKPEIVEFRLEGFDSKGEINRDEGTISISVPPYADLSALVPIVETSYGASISPSNDEPVDFSSPVTFTVQNGDMTKEYTVTVTYGAMDTKATRLMVLGTASLSSEISDPDETAAVNWALSTFDKVTYMSFDQLANDASALDTTDVVWWFHDATAQLPEIASNENVVNALQDFHNTGGGIYLSGFSPQYLETLGIVDQGDGPNDVGGAPSEFENPDPWGISFKGYADHPIFQDLRTSDDWDHPAAYLISGGAWREDNKAWWTTAEFPGYGTPLASTEWDPDRAVLVAMAEFHRQQDVGYTVAFSAGAYDWYSSEGENTYMDNVHQITQNIITYLATKTIEVRN